MTHEPTTEPDALTVEQLDEAHGGLNGHSTGALRNVTSTNSLIGLLVPAV